MAGEGAAVLIVAAVLFVAGWAVLSLLSTGRLPYLIGGFLIGRRMRKQPRPGVYDRRNAARRRRR